VGAYQRRRGHDYEREVATDLRDAIPTATVRRGQQGAGGHGASDVLVDIGGSAWLGIECKRGPVGGVPLLPALAQAVRDCDGTGRVPLAVTREDRCRSLVLVRCADLGDLRMALSVETHRDAPHRHGVVAPRLRVGLARAIAEAPAGTLPMGVLPDYSAALLRWSDLLGLVLAPLAAVTG
jgi:hypothetical protein